MNFTVLIADKVPATLIERFSSAGVKVVYEPKLGENDIPGRIADYHALVVRSTKVNAAAIEKGSKLKLIIRAGSGYNTIDVDCATKHGIFVSNCPGMNAIAVAELAMGLILSLDRSIPDNVADFRNKVWNKGLYSNAQGLYGKTLGIIGVGNIGKELARRAKAFGMIVLGHDVVPVTGIEIEMIAHIEAILKRAEILSLHLPANPSTKGMFNRDLFAKMKDGVIFINTSRPEVVDEDALIHAVREKKMKAGLDVFSGEPEDKSGSVSSKLGDVPGIYVTHHIGASTEQAQDAVANETFRIINHYLKEGTVLNLVNKTLIK